MFRARGAIRSQLFHFLYIADGGLEAQNHSLGSTEGHLSQVRAHPAASHCSSPGCPDSACSCRLPECWDLLHLQLGKKTPPCVGNLGCGRMPQTQSCGLNGHEHTGRTPRHPWGVKEETGCAPVASNHRKLGWRPGTGSPSQPLEGTSPADTWIPDSSPPEL